MMQYKVTLPETPHTYYVFDFELIFGHYVLINFCPQFKKPHLREEGPTLPSTQAVSHSNVLSFLPYNCSLECGWQLRA